MASTSFFNSQADIIVIGSGFAGLAAAIEAAEAGSSVIVLEKMMAPGGNSVISDGGIAAPGTKYQTDAGIFDSPKKMYQDMMAAGEGLNYPELVKVVTEGAKEAFIWTRDYLGVKYKNRVDTFGGHSVARCYTPEEISGSALIKRQLIRVKELNVPIYLGTYVKSLIQDDNGRVTGVEIIDGYRYNRPNKGTGKTMTAAKAVIVASGGFGSDVAFRQAQDPRLDNSLMSTNKPFATAEILKECLRVGANPVQLSRIQLGPWASPDEKGFGAGPLFGEYVVLPYGILVDPKTAKRFVNELSDRKTLAEALLKQNHPVIGIADEGAVQVAGWDLSRALAKKVIKPYASFEALAQSFTIDATALKLTMARFNKMITNGKDHDFQKPILTNAVPLEKPPFYAMRLWPKVHYTMGGIQIDTSARVIHRDQYPIPGLYAAGEVTGGIHGACRLGSCAITECLVMGRIAGKDAAKLLQ
ncbi:MAG: flavocytochrome c [Bacillota bacterium]|nr:flavocytochrome c [Bacillota bacterium]